MEWSWEVVLEVLPSMWLGLIVTIQAALVGALLAYVLGLLLALLKMSKTWIVAKVNAGQCCFDECGSTYFA